MKKVLLVDAFGIIFRSYYAFMSRPLRNKDNENVSAVFGFFKGIFSILKNENPDYLLIALEGGGKCFRSEIYPEYKANRQAVPEDLRTQIPKIIDIIEKLGIPHFFKEGYEADDIIGTIATHFSSSKEHSVLIYSSDKDLRQLIEGNVTLCRPNPKGTGDIHYDREKIFEDMGIYPEQVADFLAITGDSSDNIPGIKGIGEKGAVNLLSKWKTLENIYEHIDEITPAGTKKKLEDDKENAFLSKTLTVIKKDIDLQLDESTLERRALLLENVAQQLENDSLKTVIREIEEYNKANFGIKPTSNATTSDERAEIVETIERQPIADEAKNFIVVTEVSQLESMIEMITKSKSFAFDLETTGFNAFTDSIVSISISTETFDSSIATFVIPVNLSESQKENIGEMLTEDVIYSRLSQLFAIPNVVKIGHNMKFDLKFLKQKQIVATEELFDTMVAEYCIDGATNLLALKDMGEKYLNYALIRYEDIVPKKATLLEAELSSLIGYSGQDAFITYKLYQLLSERIGKNSELIKLFYNIEMKLLPILLDMEETGISLNTKFLEKLSDTLESDIETLSVAMNDMVGHEFNPNSPLQLREILFNELSLPVIKKTKTGASTDVDVLKKLSIMHPLPKMLLEYRTISKIKSTYTNALIEQVEPSTQRVHTTYVQTGTQTGRLSSKDPNLQNIPIRNEIGREIRRAFIPKEGHLLLSADYSQIEIFLLAEFSEDKILNDSINAGEDIHARTASILFGKEPSDVTKKERNIAKTVNFGILYGQSAFGLAEELEISRKDASSFIETYFANYSGVRDYIELLKERCRENGYSLTFWNRRRSIPEIYEKNKNIRENGERLAVNSVIQGSAADMIKLAMIKIYKRVQAENLESKLLLQIHDELIFEVPIAEIDTMKRIVRESMENGYPFRLQPKVSIETGSCWGEMH